MHHKVKMHVMRDAPQATGNRQTTIERNPTLI